MVNLLKTVLADTTLREQLGSMPADEKTVLLGSDGDPHSFAHPDCPPLSPDSDSRGAGETSGEQGKTAGEPLSEDPERSADPESHETVELASVPLSHRIAPIEEGFVPTRRVATFGEKGCGDAEYRLVGRLGSGGTGVIYQAHQRAIDREVAVKVLRSDLAADAQARSRFLTEARVIGGLDHPNVIALHELCKDEKGGLFYSMKRIDGTSWDQQLDQLPVKKNVEILLRVADAIRYAHSRGLIHRDIKPENVMLGQFGEVLLADWGLAVSHRPWEDTSEVDSAIGGTPAYMAPELAAGDRREISLRSDVYLLGAVLFQILTGYPPHHGRSLLQCIQSAAANEIRPTRVEGELMDIAMRAMATDPADRYQTVDDLIDAIGDQRQHEQSSRLVRSARERLRTGSADNQYERFRVADALLRESIELWPENKRAHAAIAELQREFASVASSKGDLDLALSLYESAGQGDSEAAARIRAELRRRDETLQRQAKYSALFTHSPEAGLLTRLSSGEVLEANERFTQLLGYEADEVVGRRMAELNVWACPERRSVFTDLLQREGQIDNFEALFVRRDGHRLHVLISGRTTTLAGEPMLVSTIRDVSQRKEAENELKRSRKRLGDLQRLAGLGTWSYDVASKEISWSEETFHLVGRSPDEGTLSFKQYLEMIHPADRLRMVDAVQRAIDDGAAYEIRVRQMLPTGRYAELIARGQPIQDEQGNTVEVYGVLIRTGLSDES